MSTFISTFAQHHPLIFALALASIEQANKERDEAKRELSDLRRKLAETEEVARRLGQAAAQWEIQAQDFRDTLVMKDAEIGRLRELAQVATAGLSQEVVALRSRLAEYEPVAPSKTLPGETFNE